MTRPRAVGVGLLTLILIVTVYISALSCPSGAIEIPGDLFTSGRCLTVVDGTVVSRPPGL